jgi:hypothetical protein
VNGKYGDLIKQARKPDNQESVNSDNQNVEPTEVEQEVNLCVKVPISLRRHWSAEAKRTGVTMTAVIVEALKAKFGEPD